MVFDLHSYRSSPPNTSIALGEISAQTCLITVLASSSLSRAIAMAGQLSGSFTASFDAAGNAQLCLQTTAVGSQQAGQPQTGASPGMRRPDSLTLAKAITSGDCRAASFFRQMDLKVLRKRLTTCMNNIQFRLRLVTGAAGEWSPLAQQKLDHYIQDPPRRSCPQPALIDAPQPLAIADGPAQGGGSSDSESDSSTSSSDSDGEMGDDSGSEAQTDGIHAASGASPVGDDEGGHGTDCEG